MGFRRFTFALAVLLLACFAPPLSHSQQAPSAGQQSVKPGINDTWKSPVIEPLVNTLENETREIYAQREKLADLVNPKPGSVVADVGSGSGFMVVEFGKRVGPGGLVYAVDINPKLLEHAMGEAKQHSLTNVKTILAKEDSTELPENSVDLVFICDTYHHFEYPEPTMRSIHRALRPGGEIVVVEFHRVPGQSPAWILDHVRGDEATFTKEIVGFGFKLIQRHNPPFLEGNYVLRFAKVSPPASRRPAS